MKKILLTGGGGFIGCHLTRFFKKRKQEIAWVSRSEPSVEGVKWIKVDLDLDKEISSFKPDCTIHLAACFDNSDVQSLIECNTLLPIKLLEALKKLPKRYRKFIYAGSYWQNGDFKQPHIPIDLYSASKRSLKPYIDFYHTYHDFSVIELVSFGTYGAGDQREKLLDRLVNSAKHDTFIKLSPGEQTLNLVHVDDICHAFQIACNLISRDKDKLNYHFSVASKEEMEVIELVRLVERLAGKLLNVSIGGVPYRDVEVFKPVYNEPMLPGWSEKHTLEEYIASVF